MCDSAAFNEGRFAVERKRTPRRVDAAGLERNAETVQGFDGERDSGAGHPERGRGWADFWGICGCAAGELSGNRRHVRGDAERGSRAPRPVVRTVQATVRAAHSADPTRKRKGISAAQAAVAGAAAGGERSAETCADDGNGGGAFLPAGGGPRDACGYARTAE